MYWHNVLSATGALKIESLIWRAVGMAQSPENTWGLSKQVTNISIYTESFSFEKKKKFTEHNFLY